MSEQSIPDATTVDGISTKPGALESAATSAPGVQAAPTPRAAPSYEGMSKDERRKLLGWTMTIAGFNMIIAWLLMAVALVNIDSSRDRAFGNPYFSAMGQQPDPNLVSRDVHLLNTLAHTINLSSKASITILAIGIGFALIAVGFGLFVLGVDGAFKLQATSNSVTGLTLESAAPGLLCFLLAAVVVCVGLSRPQTLNAGGFVPVVPGGYGTSAQGLKTETEAERAAQQANGQAKREADWPADLQEKFNTTFGAPGEEPK